MPCVGPNIPGTRVYICKAEICTGPRLTSGIWRLGGLGGERVWYALPARSSCLGSRPLLGVDWGFVGRMRWRGRLGGRSYTGKWPLLGR